LPADDWEFAMRSLHDSSLVPTGFVVVSTAEDQFSVLIRVRSGRNDSAFPNCGRHGASTVSIFDDC
jgi:hypothetical protein